MLKAENGMVIEAYGAKRAVDTCWASREAAKRASARSAVRHRLHAKKGGVRGPCIAISLLRFFRRYWLSILWLDARERGMVDR